MSKTFLVDDVLEMSCFVYAETWEEAEQICKEERLDLIGEYVGSSMWWDMPKWMEPKS